MHEIQKLLLRFFVLIRDVEKVSKKLQYNFQSAGEGGWGCQSNFEELKKFIKNLICNRPYAV